MDFDQLKLIINRMESSTFYYIYFLFISISLLAPTVQIGVDTIENIIDIETTEEF